jgi:hypothetical protein
MSNEVHIGRRCAVHDNSADPAIIENLHERLSDVVCAFRDAGASYHEIAAALCLVAGSTIKMIDCPDCRAIQFEKAQDALRFVAQRKDDTAAPRH